MSKPLVYLYSLLVLTIICVWYAVFTYPSPQILQVIACDVGQGDASLVTLGKNQILIDGGPGSKVLDCLSKHMPFWDRTIELVILTHPQKDHFGGLIDVFERYTVKNFVANSLDAGTDDYRALESAVGGQGTHVVNPHSGQEIVLGLIHLDIVNPSESFLAVSETCKTADSNPETLDNCTTKKDPNVFSVSVVLHYKNFDGLFTGDAGPDDFRRIISENRIHDVEFLKVPHHGSKNGTSEELLDASTPEIATISVGENNNYGHPNKEVLDMLSIRRIATYRTDKDGTIVVKTDGDKFWVDR